MSERNPRRVPEGATPIEAMAILDSEVFHLRERVAEDREHRSRMDERLREVESSTTHIDKLVAIIVRVTVGTAVGVCVGLVLAVVHFLGRIK